MYIIALTLSSIFQIQILAEVISSYEDKIGAKSFFVEPSSRFRETQVAGGKKKKKW